MPGYLAARRCGFFI